MLLVLAVALEALPTSTASEETLPGVGQPVVVDEIRVTLLAVKRLTRAEYNQFAPDYASEWAGGGLRLAFHVENRPGVQIPPVLGEVRVLFGRALYNAVTNAISRKPFAPGINIYGADDFFRRHGQALQSIAPRPRSSADASVVLDVFVRGSPIPRRTDGVVELEQGETHIRTSDGTLTSADMKSVKHVWFRFRLPALD